MLVGAAVHRLRRGRHRYALNEVREIVGRLWKWILLGIPLYANATGVIPVAEAMLDKGVAIGTTLAFMMSIAALSLPEMVILRKVIRWPGLALDAGVLAAAFILVGWGYGIMSTPGVVIDGQVVHAGGVPDRKAIDAWFP